MGGIVGYLGNREARQILLDCLGRLDSRDYDRAGIATAAAGKLKRLLSIGNHANLKMALRRNPLAGKIGIAHAYRAAHTDASAYPHTDCSNSLVVVHDGAVENYRQLRTTLEAQGHVFSSDSESEVIAHLLEHSDLNLESALRRTLPLLQGTFAIAVLSQHEPDKIIAARKGRAPLVVGHHHDGFFVASDVPAFSQYTRNIQILDDGEMAIVSYGGVKISRFDGTPVFRPLTQAILRESDGKRMQDPGVAFTEAQQLVGAQASARSVTVE